MKLRLAIPQSIIIGAIILFAAVNSYLITKEIYYQMLLPIAIALGYFALHVPKNLLLFVGLAAPFSLNLNKITGLEGLGLYFPTEPLLLGLTILLFISSLKGTILGIRIHQHRVSLAIYFSLFWIFVTTCSSSMPIVSIKFLISRLWFVVPLFFMATVLFKSKKYLRQYFMMYMIALAVVIILTVIRHAGYGFTQHAGHFVMNPYYKDHTSYGAVIALFIPILLGYSFGKFKTGIPRIIFRLLLGIFLIGLVFSFTRAAWLSLIVGGGVYALMKLRIKFSLVFTVVAILFAGYINFQDDIQRALSKNRQDSSEDFMEHIRSMTNISTDASNLERINRWNSAISMFEERPIVGWGPGTYMFQYAPFQKRKDLTIISTNSGTGGNAHSEYLGPLAESGFLGLIYFLLLITAVLYTGIKTYYRLEDKEMKMLVMAAIVGIVSYASHGFLNNFLDTDKLSYPFWGMMAIIVAADLYYKKVEAHDSSKKHLKNLKA